jgi:hypothetical protein
VADKLQPWAEAGLLPDFPFGTDLTPKSCTSCGAEKAQTRQRTPGRAVVAGFKSFWEGKDMPQAYQERLGLADVHSFKDAVTRRLFAGNL